MKNTGISSLWDILDKTKTPLGKRYLKYKLLNPIIDSTEINNTYDAVSEFQIKNDTKYIFEAVSDQLKSINDIQRLHRKMALKKLQPYEFITLDNSYKKVKSIISYLKKASIDNKCKIIDKELIPEKELVELDNFIEDYNQKIKMNEILGVNLNNITDSFFNKGVFQDIDEQQEKLEKYKSYFDQFALSLGAIIDNSGKTRADVKRSDKEDYFLTITKSKSKILSSLIKKNPDTCFLQLSVSPGTLFARGGSQTLIDSPE